jgi:hypothetical protein
MPTDEITIGPYAIYRYVKGHYALLDGESREELGRLSFQRDPGGTSGHWAFRKGSDLTKSLDSGAHSLRTCIELILTPPLDEAKTLAEQPKLDPPVEKQAGAIVEAMFQLECLAPTGGKGW